MTGASKILTVSYGTFSCTLEGFDDPFNTMKAIAEYFRDLAAEDRYFGAEPPQPDAAMLHRIAEREIQRRVEAKIGENGVVLRANADTPNQALSPVLSPIMAPAAASEAPRPVVTQAVTATIRPAPQLVEDEDGEVGASVVEKLSQLQRAAAPASAPVDVPPPMAEAAPAVVVEPSSAEDEEPPVVLDATSAEEIAVSAGTLAQSELADPEVSLGPDVAAEVVAEAPVPASVPVPDAAEDEAVLARLGTMIDPDEPGDEQATSPVVPEALPAVADRSLEEESFGLDTIRAALAEDLPATPTLLAQEDDGSNAIAVDEDASDPAEQMVIEAEETANAAAEADAEVEPALAHQMDPSDQIIESALAPAPMPGSDGADEGTVADAPVDAPRGVDLTAEPLPPTETVAPVPRRPVRPVRPLRPAVTPEAMVQPAAEPAPAALPAATPAPAAVADRAERARARIIRIRRGDAPAQPVAAAMGSTLSPDAEAALRAELAALAEGKAPAPAPSAGPAAAPTARLAPAAEEAVDRLMQEASSQMEGPESRRRQSAIQHLKAAVAATRADQQVTGPRKDDGNRMEPYRSALAEVVKPMTAPAASSERPAPLVLVSAQRIDRPAEPTMVAPIAPRRPIRAMSATGLAPLAVDESFEDDEAEEEEAAANIFGDQAASFAEFAERLGARTLAETMEAAAAYIATVEGRDSFTRPQLMGYVAANHADVMREDSLRSFGVLLREGRIQKSRRGQFAISEASALLAEAKKIAG